MGETDISQAEADELIAMEKHRADENEYDFPSLGGAISIPLVSVDKREEFILDLSRGKVELGKVKYQNRARKTLILVRLELAGPLHRNPDGEELPCPHIHRYREGFGDKWAFPVPTEVFCNIDDPWLTLQDFMKYCNVTITPNIRRGVF
jgi:MoaA/NifB/PqqE/SkfB family radical SAM enzyme